MRNSFLYFILFVSILSVFHGSIVASAAATINYVSTDPLTTGSTYRMGSLSGGILLYLKGTGLSADATASTVLIGGQTCVIDPSYTSNLQIGCKIPASTTFGVKTMTVTISGVAATCDTSTTCYFNYTVANSPILYGLASVAINQNSALQAWGVFRLVNSPSSLELKFNDNYLCNFGTYSSSFQGHIPDFAKCAMGPLPAGYYNAKLTVAGKGQAITSNTFYNSPAADGQVYNLTVLPQITALSSHIGTTAGQVIEITGTGFSTIPSENQVYLEQTPCQITASSNTSILCSLVSPPITDQTTLRPGHPGMRLRVFPGNKTLDQLKASTDFTGDGGTKIILLSSETAYNNRTDNYTEALEGFFKPKVTGTYKFILSSFGPSQLYISTNNGTKDNLTMIAEVKTGTPFRTYTSPEETTQISSNITLEAGKYYYMQALHSAYNEEHLTIGFNLTSSVKQVNSQKRVIQFMTKADVQQARSTFRFVKTTSPLFFTVKWNATGTIYTSNTFAYPGNISAFVDFMSSTWAPIANVTRTQYDSSGNIVNDDQLAQETRYTFDHVNTTFFGAQNLAGYPTGYLSIDQDIPGTLLLGGSANVMIGGQTFNWTFDTPAETLRDFLTGLSGQTQPRVTRYGNGGCRFGCKWIVEYDNNLNNAALPTISLTTAAFGLQGPAGKNLVFSTINDGAGTNQIVSPIPYDMLYTPETTAQITVKTRGFPASCYNSQCSYQVKEAIVPTVTNFVLRDTNVLDITIKDGQELTKANLGVTFASNDAYVVSYDSSTQKLLAEVELNDNGVPKIVAGVHIPQVIFNGSQLIKIADNITGLVFQPNITNVTLDMSSVANGFLSFQVSGTGFGYSLENKFDQTVTVDGLDCTMFSLTNVKTGCVLSQMAQKGDVAVNINSLAAEYAFNLQRALHPLEIADQVLNPTTGEITLTLNGTGFDNTTIVSLVNNVTNDTITCYVCSVSTFKIVCSTTGLPPGDYDIVTTTFDTEDTLSQLMSSISVPLEIYSISPQYGSQLGGTVITITGKGFSSIVNDNQVSMGYMYDTCDVIDANDTFIKCITRSNDNDYSEPQNIHVLQRLQFVANCKGQCQYLFSDDYTPYIVEASTTEVVSGDNLTLYGANLTMDTQIKIGGVLAQVISANESEIVVEVPNIPAGTGINITAYNPVFGNVNVLDTLTLTNSLQVLDYSPLNGSTVSTVLTINGKGFSSNATVTVAGKACTLLSVSATALTCKIGNYKGLVVVKQDGVEFNATNITFTPASSFTPVISNVVGLPVATATPELNVTLKGSYLNISQDIQIVLTSGKITYQAQIINIASNAIDVKFSMVPSGNYVLSAQIGPYSPKFNNASNTSVAIPIKIDSVNTVLSSFAGGLNLYIDGSGFTNDLNALSIKVEGFNCTIVSITYTNIVCKVPPLISDQTQSLYSFGQEQILVGTYFSAGSGETPSLAFDNSTATYFKSGSISDCSFGIDVGEGLIAQISQIEFYPQDGLADMTSLNGSVFEASVDGTNYVLLKTLGNNVYDGWNAFNPPVIEANVSGFRYIRFRRSTATYKCTIAEVRVRGTLLSSIHSADPNVVLASAKIQINGASMTIPNIVQYRADKTPIITSVFPTTGTSKGNTTLTLYGTSLSQTTKIKIDNTMCDITSVNDTQISCKTRALPAIYDRKDRITGVLTVFVEGSGKAVSTGVSYMYAERWSDKDTWGCGGFPREYDSVHVMTGMNLIIDVSPPRLEALIIEGALIFEDTDITLVAGYILVRNGFLQIGTESQPIQSNINITLYGTKQDEQLPIFGNKMIGLYEGTIDIHGKPRTVTTNLAAIASTGQSTIQVKGPVDWKAGDRIVISSTSYDPNQSEEKTIVSVTGNSIQLDTPLKYTHLFRQTPAVEGQVYEISAEVVLLSRNILIQGDFGSDRTNYGAHLLFYDPGTESTIVRLSYFEITNAGQTGYLGRFPVHFQHTGNQFQSYVKGASIHHTYQRGIQLQGTSYLTVQNNIVYAIQGYGINLENGVERFNVFEDNIVMNGKTTVQYLTTQESPLGYRISSPTNFFRRNKALCNPSYGFWFDLKSYAAGAYSNKKVCPLGEILGVFDDNIASWNADDGIRFDTYQPRTYPCRQTQYTDQVNPFAKNPPVPAVFNNITVIGNKNKGVEGVYVGALVFDNLKAFDNGYAGFDFIFADESPVNGTIVSNSVFIGNTYIEAATTSYRGLRVCRSENCFLDNNLFVNYTSSYPALEADAYTTSTSSTDSGARTIFSQALRFINVNYRTKFSNSAAYMFKDLDGSLTGITTGATVVNNMPHLRDLPGCTISSVTYDGMVCTTATTFKRIVFYEVSPSNLLSQPLKVLRLNSTSNETVDRPASDFSSISFKYGRNPSNSYGIPFALGYSYKIHFNNSLDFTSLSYELSQHSVVEDLPINFVFNYTAPRETFVFTKWGRMLGTVPVTNSTELWNIYSLIGSKGKALGDWFMDADNGRLYVAMIGGNGTKVKSVGYECLNYCPIPGNGSNNTLPKISLYWSDVTIWPNETLPQEGESIVIPSHWVLIMDINPPALGTIEIQGELKFDKTREDDSILMAKKIWVRGKLTVGSSDEPFAQKAKIILIGARNETGLLVNGFVEIGTKALAVSGELLLYGQEVTEKFTLLESLYPGDKVIKTSGSLTGWEVGHRLVLTTSRNADAPYEVVEIESISESNITLKTGVQYFHYSGLYTQTVDGLTYNIDYSAEVILLNRSITVQGSREDNWGARVVITEETDGYTYLTGRADIQSVAFDYCGQYLQNSALSFEYMTNVSAGVYSNLNSSVIVDSLAWGVKFSNTNNVRLMNTTIVNAKQFGVYFYDNSLQVEVTGSRFIGVSSDSRAIFLGGISAGLYIADIQLSTVIIQNNIASGCVTGFIIKAPYCGGASPYANNVAHTSDTGFLVLSDYGQCAEIADLMAYRTVFGVFSYFGANEIVARNNIFTDNNISININAMGDETMAKTLTIKDSFFAGFTLLNCAKCYESEFDCINKTAIMLGVATLDGKSVPYQAHDLPYDSINSYATFNAQQIFTNNSFVNFKDELLPQCRQNYIFRTNPNASDYTPYVTVTSSHLVNVAEDNLAYFVAPIAEPRCGNLPCTGLFNVLIKDADGTLLGTKGAIIPSNTGVINTTTCEFIRSNNGFYICKDERLAMLEFENLDDDKTTRIISPAMVTNNNGFSNVINAFKSHDYTENQFTRLARFPGIFQKNTTYSVEFSGTVPTQLKFQMEAAATYDYSILKVFYYEPIVVTVYNGLTDEYIRPIASEFANLAMIKPTDPCGTNFYDRDENTINFKLTANPNCKLVLKRTSVLAVNVRYDMTQADFYEQGGAARFVDKVASILGIALARIRTISIVSGSVIINVELIAEKQAEADFNLTKAELEGFTLKLQESIVNGDLNVYGAPILNYGFKALYAHGAEPDKPAETVTPTLIVGETKLILIVAVAGAVIAMALGIYCVCRYRKRRLNSKSVVRVAPETVPVPAEKRASKRLSKLQIKPIHPGLGFKKVAPDTNRASDVTSPREEGTIIDIKSETPLGIKKQGSMDQLLSRNGLSFNDLGDKTRTFSKQVSIAQIPTTLTIDDLSKLGSSPARTLHKVWTPLRPKQVDANASINLDENGMS